MKNKIKYIKKKINIVSNYIWLYNIIEFNMQRWKIFIYVKLNAFLIINLKFVELNIINKWILHKILIRKIVYIFCITHLHYT